MKLTHWLFITLLCLPSHCFSVVKRHDIPAESYQVTTPPEYLVNLPHEGHGVLINPGWIVTVAHTIFYDYRGKKIKIGKNFYQISQVIIHPDYAKPDESLFKGDAKPLIDFFKGRSDIALIKLSSNVKDVVPIDIYNGRAEEGKVITVYGNGATGNGLVGEQAETKSLKEMNFFNNMIDKSEGNWLSFSFDKPETALPMEGMHGSGDSGGPSIINIDQTPYLVGLSSWQYWQGDLSLFKGGLYGAVAYQVRLSSYVDWINNRIKANIKD